MAKMNRHYNELQDSYLFFKIAQKIKAYLSKHPDAYIYRLGIGDVSLPLCKAVIDAMHEAVNDQSRAETFHGYMPECGMEELRKAIADHYQSKGTDISAEEVFVSSGASDELGDILHLFDRDNTVLIMEPAYPAYVDANIMDGRKIIHLPASKDNGFLPMPDEEQTADLIYICSPNNPTGAVYSKEQLQKWVDHANAHQSVILFDAAYESFIEDETLPKSIFEIPGARTCAIEICSLSKTAGFTGTRLGYTLIPKELNRQGMNIRQMWIRNRTTRTNGVSYMIQKAALAVFTEEGQKQTREAIRVYKQNAAYIMEALDTCGIWYCGGKNAPYVWMKCPDDYTSWEFFDILLEKAQIVGTPGSGFGSCAEGYFRLSSFGSPQDTKEAAKRLKQLLK